MAWIKTFNRGIKFYEVIYYLKKIDGCHTAIFEEYVSSANLVADEKSIPLFFYVVLIKQNSKMDDLMFSKKRFGNIISSMTKPKYRNRSENRGLFR